MGSMNSRLKCPACGQGLSATVIRRGGFRCPMCGERLRLHGRGRLALLGAVGAAGLTCYAGGARGLSLVVWTLFSYVPFYILAAVMEGIFFPRLVIDKPKYGDPDFHITGGP